MTRPEAEEVIHLSTAEPEDIMGFVIEYAAPASIQTVGVVEFESCMVMVCPKTVVFRIAEPGDPPPVISTAKFTANCL